MADINFPEVKDRDPNSEIDMDVLNDTIEYIRPAVQADGCLLYTSPSPRD